MKKLRDENKNTPELVDNLFAKRWRENFHYIDWRRFELLAKYFKGGKYLDVGCFNSPMPYELALSHKGKAEINALDHAPKMIAHLKGKYPEVNYICHDFVKNGLPFKDEELNYIVAGEVIEHLEEPEKFIAEAMRCLKWDGILAMSTPFAEGVQEPAVSDEHLWSFVIDDIQTLCEPYGQTEIIFYQDSIKNILSWTIKQKYPK